MADWVKEQIKIVNKATKKALKSKAASRKFLEDAGIILEDKSAKSGKRG